jgi:hypothetical protein
MEWIVGLLVLLVLGVGFWALSAMGRARPTGKQLPSEELARWLHRKKQQQP